MSEAESSNDVSKSYSLIDLRDVLGIGKSTDRLISMLEKGVGALWRPKQIRREGAAQRSETEEWLALAKRHGLSSNSLEASVAERGFARLVAETETRQGNREAIAELVLEEHKHLPNPEHSNSEPSLSDDWLDQFWRVAENYSDRDMQGLFARILANAAVRNRAYSPRLLSFLQLMSAEEMNAIVSISPFVFSHNGVDGNYETVLALHWGRGNFEENEKLLQMIGNSREELLGPLGIYVESGFAHPIAFHSQISEFAIDFNGIRVNVRPLGHIENLATDGDYSHVASGLKISALGAELFKLCAPDNATAVYASTLQKLLEAMNFEVESPKGNELNL